MSINSSDDDDPLQELIQPSLRRLHLPEPLLQEIKHIAERQYPLECCGLLIRNKANPELLRHVPMKNAQDKLHALDPVSFARTARSAYAMDSAELLQVHKELRVNGEEIAVIYHSHPDGEAHFSEWDRRLALDDRGEPVYANTAYMVLSVKSGYVEKWNLFYWDQATREFEL